MSNYYMTENTNKKPFKSLEDGGFSSILNSKINNNLTSSDIEDGLSTKSAAKKVVPDKNQLNIYDSLYHSSNIRRTRAELYGGYDPIFTKTFRFGVYNPYGQLSTAREYLFFTKPDLHIMKVENSKVTDQLNDGLQSYFWTDMVTSKKRIIKCL